MGRRASPAVHHRGRSGVVLYGCVAAALAVLGYANALHNPFVYDDHDTIVTNASLVEPSNIRFLLAYSPFRPVVNVSYAVDRALWGGAPTGFHVTSVALHAATVVLLYLLTLRLIGDAERVSSAARRAPAAAAFTAFTVAAIFAVHPLFTEAVGYISGRAEVLCAAWFVAAVLASRSAMLTGSLSRGALAAVCALLAVLSKENAVALPVVLVAYRLAVPPGRGRSRAAAAPLAAVPARVGHRRRRRGVPGAHAEPGIGWRGAAAAAVQRADPGDRRLALPRTAGVAGRTVHHARCPSRLQPARSARPGFGRGFARSGVRCRPAAPA